MTVAVGRREGSGRVDTETGEFVRQLAAENRAFWVGRDVRLDPTAPRETLERQLRYRMRQGVYNELRAAELIAAWIPSVQERELRGMLPGQLDDEQRHYQLLRRRLRELGEDPDAWEPLPEWETLFDWLLAARARPTLEKLAMFQFAGETQSCEGFEMLIRLADRPSAVFYLYIGLYSVGRFLIESIRVDSFWVGSFRVPQLASLVGIALALGGLFFAWTGRKVAA